MKTEDLFKKAGLGELSAGALIGKTFSFNPEKKSKQKNICGTISGVLIHEKQIAISFPPIFMEGQGVPLAADYMYFDHDSSAWSMQLHTRPHFNEEGIITGNLQIL